MSIILCLSLTNSIHPIDLQQQIGNLHASLVELKNKLDSLTKGLNTIKNKLLGIEEPEIEIAIEQNPIIVEALQAIKAVNGQDNDLINQNFHKAQDNIESFQDIEISDAQRADAYAKLQDIKNEIKQKYQNYLQVGDAKGKIHNSFNEIVDEIRQNTATYENVLKSFLTKDTTTLKDSPLGHNSIQVVVEYMRKIIEEEIVNANNVLEDALGTMQFRTQALILFYIVLQNDFFNDKEFLKIVTNALLGYIGQTGFDHLGKCVTAQLLEKIPNMTPELLTFLAQNIIGYAPSIENLTNKKPNPVIAGKQCPQFEYYQMQFTSLGIQTKADLLRYILALMAEVKILSLKAIVVPEPIAPQPQPIIVEPEPEINQLIINISDSIEILPVAIPKGGFPVPKFKEIVAEMQSDKNRDLLNLNIPAAKGIDILGYFKLFTQKGHNYFMQHPQLKNTYQEMLSLCTLIIKCIFDSPITCDIFKVKYQNLTLLVTFTNFLLSIKQQDFASLDNPAFNPATDCLQKDDFQKYAIFKAGIAPYEHNKQNMLLSLINWFDENQRENINNFFTNSDMPKMGKTVVFKNAFEQLDKASKM